MGRYFSKDKNAPREDFIEEPWNLQVNHHPFNNQLYRENFNVNSESTCDSGSCKNLISNEIKKKHYVRLKNNIEKILYLKSKRNHINNQINILYKELSKINQAEYLNNIDSIAKINNILNKFKFELNRLDNELAYITSYEIELKELQDEMINKIND
jgi:hypothetical protein